MTGLRRLAGPLPRALAALRPDPWRSALAVATGVAALGCAIGLLGVSGWLITRASQQPPVLYLMVAVVTVRALGLGRGLLRYAERLAGHDIALRGAVTLRTTLFARLGAAPASVVAHYRRGDLLARLGADVDDLADLVVRALLPCAVAAVTGLLAAVTVALILPAAGAVLAAGLLLAGVVAPVLAGRSASRAEHGAADAEAAVVAETLDTFETLPELTVAGTVETRLEHGQDLERTLAEERDAAARPAAAAATLGTLGTGGSVLGCLVVGVAAVSAGTLDPVLLTVVALVALASAETVVALPSAAVALVRGRHAAARVCELLDASDVADRARPAAGIHAPRRPDLRARNLACGAGTVAVAGVDLDLTYGRRVAVVGASGSGKTTLLRTIAGLLPARAGLVQLGEGGGPWHDLAEYTDDELRAAITFVADDAHVFTTTIRENLRLAAPDADDGTLVAALRVVGLSDPAGGWLEQQPSGLDTVIGGEAPGAGAGRGGLSGGERRRLLLARAVLVGSGVLLLDEPAEHLDTATADALVASALHRGPGSLAGDRTVVVVTHRLAPLAAADEVIVLDDGRVAARGTHEELLLTHPPYREAYEHETPTSLAA